MPFPIQFWVSCAFYALTHTAHGLQCTTLAVYLSTPLTCVSSTHRVRVRRIVTCSRQHPWIQAHCVIQSRYRVNTGRRAAGNDFSGPKYETGLIILCVGGVMNSYSPLVPNLSKPYQPIPPNPLLLLLSP